MGSWRLEIPSFFTLPATDPEKIRHLSPERGSWLNFQLPGAKMIERKLAALPITMAFFTWYRNEYVYIQTAKFLLLRWIYRSVDERYGNYLHGSTESGLPWRAVTTHITPSPSLEVSNTHHTIILSATITMELRNATTQKGVKSAIKTEKQVTTQQVCYILMTVWYSWKEPQNARKKLSLSDNKRGESRSVLKLIHLWETYLTTDQGPCPSIDKAGPRLSLTNADDLKELYKHGGSCSPFAALVRMLVRKFRHPPSFKNHPLPKSAVVRAFAAHHTPRKMLWRSVLKDKRP